MSGLNKIHVPSSKFEFLGIRIQQNVFSWLLWETEELIPLTRPWYPRTSTIFHFVWHATQNQICRFFNLYKPVSTPAALLKRKAKIPLISPYVWPLCPSSWTHTVVRDVPGRWVEWNRPWAIPENAKTSRKSSLSLWHTAAITHLWKEYHPTPNWESQPSYITWHFSLLPACRRLASPPY